MIRTPTLLCLAALTATLAAGGLGGFWIASRVLKNGFDPFRLAALGALAGIPAFMAVIASSELHTTALFAAGTFFIGFGGGLFGHGTLTATMQLAPHDQTGMALGAWGAAQASAAGMAIALGGILRDAVTAVVVRTQAGGPLQAPAAGYVFVYSLEIVLLAATLVAMAPLIRNRNTADAPIRRSTVAPGA